MVVVKQQLNTSVCLWVKQLFNEKYGCITGEKKVILSSEKQVPELRSCKWNQ